MIVRDLFSGVDEARIIARAIFEDGRKEATEDNWITKYYSQLTKLKNSKVRKSSMMLYFSVNSSDDRLYGVVSGFEYKDIKAGYRIYYGIEYLNVKKYAALYVPEYTVQRYGKEVVAAEALREYGWNRYDENIVCPDDVRKRVIEEFNNMESGIFPVDVNYLTRCQKQFTLTYEGKEVPMWEEDKDAAGVVMGRGDVDVLLLL